MGEMLRYLRPGRFHSYDFESFFDRRDCAAADSAVATLESQERETHVPAFRV